MRKLKKIFFKIKKGIFISKTKSFEGGGERMDINLNLPLDYDNLNMYQKSHWKRYQFAKEFLPEGKLCGDFACGTGYGSVILSQKFNKVIGGDINKRVIEEIKERYIKIDKIDFLNLNLLDLNYKDYFDSIVSFETIEHFNEDKIPVLFLKFYRALKQNGYLIFSTPYMQERSDAAIKMGFHLTFYINELKTQQWMNEAGFKLRLCQYQNYDTHSLENNLVKKDFIICCAQKV